MFSTVFPTSKNFQYQIGDNLIHAHDDVVLSLAESPVLRKTITITELYPSPSTLRIKFDLSTEGATAYGRIYKNGAPYGTQQSTSSTTYVTFSEDLQFAQGDLIQLYLWTSTSYRYAYARNFRVYGTLTAFDLIKGFVGSNS